MQRCRGDYWYVMVFVTLTSQFIILVLILAIEEDGSKGISAMFCVFNGRNCQSSVIICSFGFKEMVEVVGKDIEPCFRSPPALCLPILWKLKSPWFTVHSDLGIKLHVCNLWYLYFTVMKGQEMVFEDWKNYKGDNPSAHD